jgi:hypothetical protein
MTSAWWHYQTWWKVVLTSLIHKFFVGLHGDKIYSFVCGKYIVLFVDRKLCSNKFTWCFHKQNCISLIQSSGAHIRGVWGGVTPPHVLWNISKKSVPKPEWDEKVGPAKIWKILSFCVEKINIGGHVGNGSCINIRKTRTHTQIRVHCHKSRDQLYYTSSK